MLAIDHANPDCSLTLVKHLELKSALDKIAGISINDSITLPQLKAYTKCHLPDDLKKKFFTFIFDQSAPVCTQPTPNDFKVSCCFNQFINGQANRVIWFKHHTHHNAIFCFTGLSLL